MTTDKPTRSYSLLAVLAVFVVLTVGSIFVSWQLFYFVAGVTAIIGIIVLTIIWDDIVVWFSARK